MLAKVSRFVAVFVVISLVALSAWTNVSAQLRDANDNPLSLQGYDPVAYFTDGEPTRGTDEYETTWDEVRYQFASPQHKRMFAQDPEKYAPQFAGSCTMAMTNGVMVHADPEAWIIHDGKLYVFASLGGREQFLSDPDKNITRAEYEWTSRGGVHR